MNVHNYTFKTDIQNMTGYHIIHVVKFPFSIKINLIYSRVTSEMLIPHTYTFNIVKYYLKEILIL